MNQPSTAGHAGADCVPEPGTDPARRRPTRSIALLSAVLVAGAAAVLLWRASTDGQPDVAALTAGTIEAATARWSFEARDVSAEGLVDLRSGAASLTGDWAGQDRTLRFVEGDVYAPAGHDEVTAARADAKWLRIRALTPGGPIGLPAGSALGSSARSILDDLAVIATDVTQVGQDVVRGDDTTRYAVSLASSTSLPATLGGHPGIEAESASLDLWVDKQGRIRRLRAEVAYRGVAPSTTVIELWDFGVDVDVQAPPEDQVVDYEDYIRQAQEASGADIAAFLERQGAYSDRSRLPPDVPVFPGATLVFGSQPDEPGQIIAEVYSTGGADVQDVARWLLETLETNGWTLASCVDAGAQVSLGASKEGRGLSITVTPKRAGTAWNLTYGLLDSPMPPAEIACAAASAG